MNPYGHFDDDKREYVITRPDTPLPWINYLGSNDFYGIITNTAGGYCFYLDARLRRLLRYRYNNIPMDINGRYLYVKDGDSVWNPMWKPMKIELDKYECRHGMGYTRIISEKDGLQVEVTYFVPVTGTLEIWDVRLRNTSNKPKSVRLWGFVEWCLWDAWDDQTNYQRNFSIGQVEVEDDTVFHKTEYRERRNHFAYFHSSKKSSGFDTSRDGFVGLHNGLHEPAAIQEGACRNSVAHGWAPVGVHQLDFELAPGAEERFHFLLGYAENDKDKKFIKPHVINKEPFAQVKQQYPDSAAVDKAFAALSEHWENLLGGYQTDTPDEQVNRMVNIWNAYQCMVTFNMSRSASFYETGVGRGMGYRDSNQDILGFVHMIPERARQRLIDLASTQLSDGTCYHQYQPLTKKGNADIGGGFNDDPLWLILAVSSYIKETGDTTILDAKAGYADVESSNATMMDHLKLSLQYTLDNRGPHKLPHIGHADWNDCLNLNCFSETPGESFQLAGDIEGSDAESVMIAGLFCAAGEEMAGIYKLIGQPKDADKILASVKEMRSVVLESGWDGDWFLRAYDAAGNKVGSKSCDEGKIFIESQGWGVLGGIGIESGQARQAMDSVKEHLATENGVILQQPGYQTYHKELGEISSYPPGYKENAGIFTHNNTWIQIAETILGDGDAAMDYYKSICPATKEAKIETYRAEPYVYSQMTAGRDAAIPGEGKNSWLTGTASWSFVSITQYILGVKPGFNGLEINPCIPKDWQAFNITRVYRGKTYNISVSNPNNVSKGIASVTVDGTVIDGNIIPLDQGGDVVDVKVVMG